MGHHQYHTSNGQSRLCCLLASMIVKAEVIYPMGEPPRICHAVVGGNIVSSTHHSPTAIYPAAACNKVTTGAGSSLGMAYSAHIGCTWAERHFVYPLRKEGISAEAAAEYPAMLIAKRYRCSAAFLRTECDEGAVPAGGRQKQKKTKITQHSIHLCNDSAGNQESRTAENRVAPPGIVGKPSAARQYTLWISWDDAVPGRHICM